MLVPPAPISGGSLTDALTAAAIAGVTTYASGTLKTGFQGLEASATSGLERGTIVAGKAVALGTVSGASSAMRGGRFLPSFVSTAASTGLDAWKTTKWDLASSDRVTRADLQNVDRSWLQIVGKSGVEAAVGGAVARLNGQSSEFGALRYGLSAFANEIYHAYVPEDPQFLGPGDSGMPKTDANDVVLWLDHSNFGEFWDGAAHRGPFSLAEGGPLSRFANGYVPGMDATSKIHDVWDILGDQTICESDACVSTMLPSAAVAYGALYRNVRSDFY